MNTLIHHPARHVAGILAVTDSPLPRTADTLHTLPVTFPQLSVPEKVPACCTPLSVLIADCLNRSLLHGCGGIETSVCTEGASPPPHCHALWHPVTRHCVPPLVKITHTDWMVRHTAWSSQPVDISIHLWCFWWWIMRNATCSIMWRNGRVTCWTVNCQFCALLWCFRVLWTVLYLYMETSAFVTQIVKL